MPQTLLSKFGNLDFRADLDGGSLQLNAVSSSGRAVKLVFATLSYFYDDEIDLEGA